MASKKTQQGTNENGFTLVEMLLTILVLGIAILGLSGMYYLMQQVGNESAHYDLAVRAARTEIEELRNSGYNSLSTSSPPTFPTSLLTGLPSNSSGSVTVSQPLPSLKEVNVSITYSDYGQSQTVTLSSDIGIIGISQS
ncbi:MAG: type IV pilus modification PilV family protein [Candidatus Saccharimonadales bacterium]